MSPGGIRTHDLSRRAAVDLRLRPRVHWDQLSKIYNTIKLQFAVLNVQPDDGYIYIYIYIAMYMCVYIYMYIYIYTHTYIYIYSRNM